MKVKEPEFTAKWWTTARPTDVKGLDLEKALKSAEKAFAAQNKNGDFAAISICLKALKAIPSAASKSIKECDAKKHKDVIAALKKYDRLVKIEISRLESAQRAQAKAGKEDDDVGDDQLFEKEYLFKMMKLIKSAGKELNFGFGLNTNAPDASDLLLHRKKKPEILFKVLKKTKKYNNRLLTYGYAKADSDDGQTLVLRLERGANEPPRIVKLGREFLRSDKTLKFKKLKVVLPGGRTLEDSEPIGDGASQADLDFPTLVKSVNDSLASWNQAHAAAEKDLDKLLAALADLDDRRANTAATRIRDSFSRIPNVRDALTALRMTAQRDDLEGVGAAQAVFDQCWEECRYYVREDEMLQEVDDNPYVSVQIRGQLFAALDQIVGLKTSS